MTIKELENRCSLDRATIRFYEKEGLIAPKRLPNGYRDYSQDDALALDKISLLRQLDFPLEDIRLIQRGEVPLGVALEKQTEALRTHHRQTERALEIAGAIRKDGASYQTLQPMKYRAYLPPAAAPGPVALPAEQYPAHGYRLRRIAARLLDGLLLLLPILVVLHYVIRPALDEDGLFSMAALLGWLLMPVAEGLLLCKWGYTPGKWLMGLCLRSMGDDKNPTWWEGFRRCWQIYWHGFGLWVPPFQYLCMFRCWQRGDREEAQPWDEYDFDYTLLDRRDWQEHLLMTATAAAIALCIWLCDGIIPG